MAVDENTFFIFCFCGWSKVRLFFKLFDKKIHKLRICPFAFKLYFKYWTTDYAVVFFTFISNDIMPKLNFVLPLSLIRSVILSV
jgi:hypothetical protein